MSAEKLKYNDFGTKDKIGYLIGNIANDFTFVFASLYLQVFYTDVLGINAGIVGTMFIIARIVDAFTDTLMGRIADKLSFKNGKFKPWLLYVCVPVAIASFLMYQSSLAGASMTVKILYMFITYLFWGSVCYTAINIPYGSMASVMSSEADDRASLSTSRGIGSMVPQIVIGVILPIFLYKTLPDGTRGVNAAAFPILAMILGLISVVCYLVCYFLCTERVKPKKENLKAASFKETLSTFVTNRTLVAICLVFIFFLAAQMLSQTISNYIFKDYFNNTLGLTVINAVGFLPVLILAPFSVPLTRKFGKKAIGVFASVVGTVAYSILFLLRTQNMWVYITVSIVGLMGFGLFNLIIWAFITDVIDDHEITTGTRQDGTIYAICSFSRKLGQGIASGIGGWSLAIIGYAEGIGAAQSTNVKNGIYNIATGIPALLYLLVALCLIFLYPLSKKRVNDNILLLKSKHND